MTESAVDSPVIVLAVGLIVIASLFIKGCLGRTGVPPLVGFLLFGIVLRVLQSRLPGVVPETQRVVGFLANLGLITLLFRVGLESDLKGLARQLRSACRICGWNMVLTFAPALAAAVWGLCLGLLPGLVVATALTATSVGITVAVWRDAGALDTPNGRLLLDVAELDDIAAVVLMGILFAVLPRLHDGDAGGAWPLTLVVAGTAATFLVKLAGFGLGCILFAVYLERPVSAYFRKMDPPPDFMLVVLAVGFVIAALADMAGFSLAIGAFLAGIVFSRDPEAVKREGSFIPLYEFFSPFFFIAIGMGVSLAELPAAVELGAALVVVACLTKLLANGLPAWRPRGAAGAVLIGASMVPRAEIAMVIAERGRTLGAWAMPPEVFGAMVLVSVTTCTLAPLAVRALLVKWPQTERDDER